MSRRILCTDGRRRSRSRSREICTFTPATETTRRTRPEQSFLNIWPSTFLAKGLPEKAFHDEPNNATTRRSQESQTPEDSKASRQRSTPERDPASIRDDGPENCVVVYAPKHKHRKNKRQDWRSDNSIIASSSVKTSRKNRLRNLLSKSMKWQDKDAQLRRSSSSVDFSQGQSSVSPQSVSSLGDLSEWSSDGSQTDLGGLFAVGTTEAFNLMTVAIMDMACIGAKKPIEEQKELDSHSKSDSDETKNGGDDYGSVNEILAEVQGVAPVEPVVALSSVDYPIYTTHEITRSRVWEVAENTKFREIEL